ncbi:hypothetical protein [Teichococcus vastitatis]|uniref:Uncharacterized protein n=1 Tax=Teichococcus vastitatis TaxID=2307076 RepID=A0ABS9W8P9_9PROT|nr:hypothetical protein [Pseudoroseomonas vastitatis]MCI0755669.1 hypothetical protein [Pseudoroseomonas vastitatis]
MNPITATTEHNPLDSLLCLNDAPAPRPNRPRVLLYRDEGELILDVRGLLTVSMAWASRPCGSATDEAP